MAMLNKSLSASAFSLSAALLLLAGTHSAHAPAEPALACHASSEGDAPTIEEEQEQPDRVQQTLATYLSRRFTIAAEPAGRIVSLAYRAGADAGLDPLLLLAMISVESRFNPFAESALGAKGLMQIIPRFHLEKLQAFGGEDSVLDPEANIRVGAQILREYVARTGTLEAALQFYNGSAADASGQYAQKILAERSRLEAAVYPDLRRAAVALNNTQGS